MITPLYFKSEECRKELLGFVGHARSVGAEDLVLPLLYLDVPQLHVEDPGDEAVAVVKSRLWQDCRDLRLLAEDDPAYRQKVNALAGRLIEIDESLPNESLPPENRNQAETKEESSEGSGAAGEPGYLEHFAAAEVAIPRWVQTLDELPKVMERIGAVADVFGQRMQRIDDEGGNFAKKLVIAREFAKALAEPADELLRLGQEYSASLVELDPAILSLIRLIEDDPAQASPDEVHELVVQLRQLARDARTNTSELRDLVRVLDQTRRMSRELAPPIDKMKQGLRQVIDGQALFDEWERRFAELDERDNGPERGGSTPAQD